MTRPVVVIKISEFLLYFMHFSSAATPVIQKCILISNDQHHFMFSASRVTLELPFIPSAFGSVQRFVFRWRSRRRHDDATLARREHQRRRRPRQSHRHDRRSRGGRRREHWPVIEKTWLSRKKLTLMSWLLKNAYKCSMETLVRLSVIFSSQENEGCQNYSCKQLWLLSSL